MMGTMANKDFIVGFDLGGTKMAAAVVTSNKIIASARNKTSAEQGQEAVVRGILETIWQSLKNAGIGPQDLEGICVAAPGPIDRKKGIMLFTPNLGFENYPIKETIEKEFGVPMDLENDVNAGTYGEFIAGAASGYSHVVGVFPGTGIGGGIIIDGKLFTGGSGNAGEIGHMIIQVEGPLCGCGHYGCLEALASRTALAKDAVSISGSGKPISSYGKAGTDIKKYKSSIFKQGLTENDPYITELINRAAYFLGIGIANCIHILNPEVVVVGGGLVEKLGDYYMREIEKSLIKHTLPQLLSEVKVVKAVLGDEAALLGAAGIFKTKAGSK